MKKPKTSIFFDKNDHELLDIVNEVLDSGSQAQSLRSLLIEHMHPQGIKEMAAPRGLRIAYAIAGLLGSFERGQASDRIKALRSLRDEVFFSATTYYQKNTARVLVQIMKELLRSRDNNLRQLKLAHDFRMVSTGNPRHVRAQLDKYHLLEMPEEWNQYAFDDHVHDANTKGRKSPTHLVMDAWIKGIRYLTVIYYNYVNPAAVEELIEASSILDIHVQIGIEMTSPFRGKYVRFSWEPHSFTGNQDFLNFLQDDAVVRLMEEGKEVSSYQQQYVFGALELFNSRHRQTLNNELDLGLEPLAKKDFLSFVGTGQPSILHLARFILNAVTELGARKGHDILCQEKDAPQAEKELLSKRIRRLQAIDIDYLIENFLIPVHNPELHNPLIPSESPELPALLKLPPQALMARLLSLHSSSKFTLKLSNLSLQDTLELLYNCEGMISHVESYNLKNASHGIVSSFPATLPGHGGDAVSLKSPQHHYRLINDLQNALNDDNVIALKRVVRAIIWDYDEELLGRQKQLTLHGSGKAGEDVLEHQHQCMVKRKNELTNILFNLEKFHNYYKKKTLGSRIGSGSTGQAEHQHGMGLVVLETLPPKAQKAVRGDLAQNHRMLIPVTARMTSNSHCRSQDQSVLSKPGRILGKFGLSGAADLRWNDWTLDSFSVHPESLGNVATLGGLGRNGSGDGFFPKEQNKEKLDRPWTYLNTNLKNSLKVLCGFIPAFLTFSLTKDWWVLAYFGAFIWFTITGSRNIIQSVLGGGGLRRSPLLPWNSLVSWSRIADSLLYTGFSVPLLDYLVKTLLLDQTFGVTTATNPILLYGVMGLANGIYICSHNLFRGLPKSAAVGNLFRSVLAIPLAILLNSIIGSFLTLAAVPDVAGALQKWAAVISKLASDCVAAGIEGLADRQTNIKARLKGYRSKIAQLFAVFARLDLLFPEEDVLDILQSPKMTMETLSYEEKEQEKLIIVNALDLMYFWMYQPRARKALLILRADMSLEEWLIFYRSQLVLKRYREISQLFVDGLVGRNFSKALAFYLDRYEAYLDELEKLGHTDK